MNRAHPQIPYTESELMSHGPQRTFCGPALREIAFPLGGIGTGCISLGGRGQLRDWEIFNRPNQGFRPAFTFATLRAQADGAEPITRVLESPVPPPYSGPHGIDHMNGEGLPHLASNTFRGEYPFAWLDFPDGAMPLKVGLEAFNPFIPLNDADSGLPVAILTYTIENVGSTPVSAVLAWTMQNVIGYACSGPLNRADMGGNRNAYRAADGLRGFLLDSAKESAAPERAGTMALATPWPDVTYAADLGPGWDFDTGHAFWDAIAGRGAFDDSAANEPTPDGQTCVCALGAKVTLQPGESARMPFIIAWHFPTYCKHWSWRQGGEDGDVARWINHYAQPFDDAWAVAADTTARLGQLHADSMKYHDALFTSTLPAVVLDAASSQTSTLKTPTCLRLEDGTFYGFEGCSARAGCCPGSCTHVWNYQQALPFLFPALERSMRAADYRYNLRESDGKMAFRIDLPLGTTLWGYHAAADGQLGGIMKTYRDWLVCGDDDWLRGLWPSLKKSLSYVWEEWDKDRDGLLEGVQHNTYDIELQGPNPLIGVFFLGALRAAEEMARRLGEDEDADEYRRLFEEASAKTDEHLYNGEYYVQKYDPEKVKTQQFGDGCLSDQMLGQWLASICGLGHLLPAEHVRSTLAAVFRYNWQASLADHANPQRIYAVADDAGLLMCTWPRGNRPLIPTRYCDEVWTGIEYQVASHLIMEGFVAEGLTIVKGTRDRHDGLKRNPWDEPECGSHYARAMASWGLILALSGYRCCAADGLLQFAPQINADDFRTFWSTDAAWGTYAQKVGGMAGVRLTVLSGAQSVRTLRLRLPASGSAEASLGEQSLACTVRRDGDWAEVAFDKPVTIPKGAELAVKLSLEA